MCVFRATKIKLWIVQAKWVSYRKKDAILSQDFRDGDLPLPGRLVCPGPIWLPIELLVVRPSDVRFGVVMTVFGWWVQNSR